MANYGNTGQRYKMSLCTGIEAQNDHAIIHLSCGHSERAYPYSTNLERFIELLRRRIGKRQRCYKCEVAG